MPELPSSVAIQANSIVFTSAIMHFAKSPFLLRVSRTKVGQD